MQPLEVSSYLCRINDKRLHSFTPCANVRTPHFNQWVEMIHDRMTQYAGKQYTLESPLKQTELEKEREDDSGSPPYSSIRLSLHLVCICVDVSHPAAPPLPLPDGAAGSSAGPGTSEVPPDTR